jgi:hypothetical protein
VQYSNRGAKQCQLCNTARGAKQCQLCNTAILDTEILKINRRSRLHEFHKFCIGVKGSSAIYGWTSIYGQLQCRLGQIFVANCNVQLDKYLWPTAMYGWTRLCGQLQCTVGQVFVANCNVGWTSVCGQLQCRLDKCFWPTAMQVGQVFLAYCVGKLNVRKGLAKDDADERRNPSECQLNSVTWCVQGNIECWVLQTDRLTDRQTDWQTDWLTDWLTDRQTLVCVCAFRQTDRQTDSCEAVIVGLVHIGTNLCLSLIQLLV